MRPRSLSFAFPLLLLACSGASSAEISGGGPLDADAAVGTPSPRPSEPEGDGGMEPLPGMPGTISGNGTLDAAAADGAIVFDAGASSPGADASTPGVFDGGATACSGTLEAEPNDTAATATPFTTSICGALPDNDVDYVSFALRADAKHIDVNYGSSSPVAFRLFVKGQSLDVLDSASSPLPFFPGETYLFQLTAKAKHVSAYELRVIVN